MSKIIYRTPGAADVYTRYTSVIQMPSAYLSFIWAVRAKGNTFATWFRSKCPIDQYIETLIIHSVIGNMANESLSK